MVYNMQNKISADNGENKEMWEITLYYSTYYIIDKVMQQLLKQAVVRNDACTLNSPEQALKINKMPYHGTKKGKVRFQKFFISAIINRRMQEKK